MNEHETRSCVVFLDLCFYCLINKIKLKYIMKKKISKDLSHKSFLLADFKKIKPRACTFF